jgi:hypothetical protein
MDIIKSYIKDKDEKKEFDYQKTLVSNFDTRVFAFPGCFKIVYSINN